MKRVRVIATPATELMPAAAVDALVRIGLANMLGRSQWARRRNHAPSDHATPTPRDGRKKRAA